MKRILIFITIFLLMTSSVKVLSQTWKKNIDEIYQKKGSTSWGDIYSKFFNRNEFRKSYALVIGVGDYNQDWNKLEAPYHDAIRVRDFLINDAGFDYVITLTNAKAIKAKINKLMEETFPKLITKNDRFLFYYSGHGTQRMIGSSPLGYLPLQNSGFETFGNMISMEEIERWDRVLSPTRHVLFILDCCFSGLAGIQKKSPLTDKKLDRLSQYAHHLITAGSANEESVASSKWNGSLFTDAFLKAIEGRADLSSGEYEADGIVSLKELMKYIGDRIDDESVKLKSKNPLLKGIKMSPQISDLQDSEGEFFFITKNIKREETKHVSDNALNYDVPTEIKRETIKKQPESETKPSFGLTIKKPVEKISTSDFEHDSEGKYLTITYVKSMLIDKNFYDSKWNKNGKGFDNDFEVVIRKGEKVVVDRASGLIWQQSGSSNMMNYEQAKKWIEELNQKGFAGYHNWRLPTLEEAMSLMESEKRETMPFNYLYIAPEFDKPSVFWTFNLVQSLDSFVWNVDLRYGNCEYTYAKSTMWVRAVCSMR